MPKRPRRPAQLAGKIFDGRAAIAAGLLTVAELRSKAWQPVVRGIYADARLTMRHELRCVAVSSLVLPPDAAVAGRSAALVYGVRFAANARDPVEVLLSPTARLRRSDMRVHIGSLAGAEYQLYRGVRVTTPTRTCWDLAQWVDVVEAVVIVDGLLATGLVTIDQLNRYLLDRAALRGWRRLQQVVKLVDGAAGSPQESRLRTKLILAGIPRPVSQYVVVDDGEFVGRVDLAWPEYKIAMEYDGLWHAASPDQIHADRRRLNRLQAAGWVVLHVTAQRLRDGFDGVVRELRALMRSRRPSAVR